MTTSDPSTLDRDDAGEEPHGSGLRSLVEWVVVVGGALIIALVIKTFLLQAFYIPSSSMVSTLNIGDRVLVNKLSYDLHDVNRGDVIVFTRPASLSGGPDDPKDLIKRVIGRPGDTVQSRDGKVYVNGRVLEEPYLQKGVVTDGMDEPVTVPEGHVWVMGDNRGDSADSRVFGPVPEDTIVGRAFMRMWPPARIGSL